MITDRGMLIQVLVNHGHQIGTESAAGKELAKSVTDAYCFWQRCPGDNMAMLLCANALDKWLKENNLALGI